MSQKRRIIFRADGNSQIGLGHVVRSLALADMLRHEFECVFAIQAPAKELQEQIRQTCDGIIILPRCEITEERFIYELDAYISEEEIVVLDGYNFDTRYQKSIKAKGSRLVCIDDIHAYHFVADAVISHVVGLKKEQFSVESYTKLYIGAEYALLRAEFLSAARQIKSIKSDRLKVFVCLGGADPANYSLQVLYAVAAEAQGSQFFVVIGSANKNKQSLAKFASSALNEVILLENLDAKDMVYYMQQSAVAITSASSVAYEYFCTKGILYLVQTATNQSEVYHYLIEHRLAFPLSKFGEALKEVEEEELIKNVSKLFDGRQQQRLLEIFTKLTAK